MIGVCVKWVRTSAPSGGLSAADEAAIEIGLRHGKAHGMTVIAVTAGGPACEEAVRVALACGATTAVRVNAPDDADSATVAAALAPVLANTVAVWCGDYSIDRGTGSVPALLAAGLDRQQALGLVGVDLRDPLRVTRRLDGGRREMLRITGPAVLSVEGSVARLRRATLRAALAAQTADVVAYDATPLASSATPFIEVRPYRPRARVLRGPVGVTPLDRLRALTDVSGAPQAGETVEGSAAEAAKRILETLRDWGYLS
ncbi:MAG TPA: mycofactocin-associated electron transfer flavoprotein beta subunit [Ilumatobacteraceae bacterium]